MLKIEFQNGRLSPQDEEVLIAGFTRHTAEQAAPAYLKKRLNWLAYDDAKQMMGVLTADLYWDWLYIDELWVDEKYRGTGLGKSLMGKAEEYAKINSCTGLWLWTQDWQAAGFYEHLGYEEFTRFPDLPKGHHRLGLRKFLLTNTK